MNLPLDAQARKAIPIYSGFVKYFPHAICAVAELSAISNEQHNPGEPVHWDRSKSADELDAMMRHTLDEVLGYAYDSDGVLHATKRAWRAMADLEKKLEARSIGMQPVQTFADVVGIQLAQQGRSIWEVEGEGEPAQFSPPQNDPDRMVISLSKKCGAQGCYCFANPDFV